MKGSYIPREHHEDKSGSYVTSGLNPSGSIVSSFALCLLWRKPTEAENHISAQRSLLKIKTHGLQVPAGFWKSGNSLSGTERLLETLHKMTYLGYTGNLVGQKNELLFQGSHRALQGSAKASGPPSFPTEISSLTAWTSVFGLCLYTCSNFFYSLAILVIADVI